MGLSTFNMLKHLSSNNGVVIEGELLKKLQTVMLDILQDFDVVCSKYNLYYSLCGGSALGAVRHKGFIPWDDDVDVFMTRKSYDKFLKIFSEALGNKYTLHSPETTPELGMPIAQLSLNGSIYRTHLAPNRKKPGIFMDIFILENVPDNIILRYIHGFLSLSFGLALSCSRYAQDKEVILDFFSHADETAVRSLKVKIFIGKILNMFASTCKWCKIANYVNEICHNEFSRYVSCPSGRKHYFKELYKRDFICQSQRVPFDRFSFMLMKRPEYYLTKLYGTDYMKPPKKEDREKHCILECKLP